MPKGMTKTLILGLALAVAASCCQMGFAAPYEGVTSAKAAFSRGQANEALRAVSETLRANSGDAAAWNLECRIFLAQDQSDRAIGSCQQAVRLAPSNSEYHRWLAHAYGEKASRAKLLSAYQTAKLAHAEFERAVALDGRNAKAISDLGKYYIEAPRMLGGGFERAEAMAQRLQSLDAARADELRALVAEAQKDYAGAEQKWRARIAESKASSETTAQAWMDLGNFYRRRGQWGQMLAALKTGAAADTGHGPALADGASTLLQARQEPALAEQWLREYLNGNNLTEAAPAFVAHAELGDLLKMQGDRPEADREFAAAHALSGNYVETATINTGD